MEAATSCGRSILTSDVRVLGSYETGVAETVTMGEMLPYGFRGDILK